MKLRTTLPFALGAGLLLALAAPLAASAHISLTPDNADPGSYTTVVLNVPSESQTATTDRIELTLPAETPFSSVRYVPVPGWTVETEAEQIDPPVQVGDAEVAEAVTKVTWTAEPGSGISAGQLQQFTLSVGPVPEADFIVFAVDQIYSDGETVSWDQEGDDVERPAPVLFVTEEPPSDDHGAAAVGTDTGDEAVDGEASSTGSGQSAGAATGSEDVLARVLGIAGLAVGAVGVAFGIAARRRQAAR